MTVLAQTIGTQWRRHQSARGIEGVTRVVGKNKSSNGKPETMMEEALSLWQTVGGEQQGSHHPTVNHTNLPSIRPAFL